VHGRPVVELEIRGGDGYGPIPEMDGCSRQIETEERAADGRGGGEDPGIDGRITEGRRGLEKAVSR